ncbi:MAG TPA: acyl carrier protein [Streptomyces sp.]|uniref:acyl carrier protein n=1 Tax=Streptomyces sp. TaxID=1931 RepID=UPI002D4ACFEF|nr:acyl carrier protein [Streptomyces sp.]HZG04296.1 acyl carrier protein [Streptomyces sp.]
MTDDTVTTWIIERLAQLSTPQRPVPSITGDQSLTEDLGIDSLAFIETMVAFEEKFDVRLDEDRLLLSAYTTVDELVGHLTSACVR